MEVLNDPTAVIPLMEFVSCSGSGRSSPDSLNNLFLEENETFETVIPEDFHLRTSWKVGTEEFWSDGVPKYIIDTATSKKYWNETHGCVRIKCCLLALVTPLVHTIIGISHVVFRLFSALFCLIKGDQKAFLRHLFTGVLIVPSIIFLELSALYGIMTPYNGRKIYATFERILYGDLKKRPFLAPCFQPNPQFHLLGGSPAERDSW